MRRLSWAVAAALFAQLVVASPGADEAARANNGFGFSLFNATQKKTEKGNKFLSPVSAYLALSMLYNGAEQKTAAEIASVLHVSEFSLDGMNGANRELLSELTSQKGFVLRLANSLWVRKSFLLRPDFVERVKDSYGAELTGLDFASPAAALTINGWVKKATEGKISEIVPPTIAPETMLYLINATYFDAQWEAKFLSGETFARPFTTSHGEVRVPTMTRWGGYRTIRALGADVIDLPYQGGAVSMVVILPPKGVSPDAIARKLDAASWSALTASLDAKHPQPVRLDLPKLEFSYEDTLNGALKGMGMARAFGEAAELHGISDDPRHLYVSNVKQKTYLQVDEEGTKAAAVTAVEVGAESVERGELFLVDHPYLFAIRDHKTGAVLFLGSVAEPEGGKLPARSTR